MHAVHDGLLLCMLWQSGVSFLPDHAMLIIWQCTLTCEVGAMALKSNAWTILFPNQRLCRNLPVSKPWGSILLLLHNHSSTILKQYVPKWKPVFQHKKTLWAASGSVRRMQPCMFILWNKYTKSANFFSVSVRECYTHYQKPMTCLL